MTNAEKEALIKVLEETTKCVVDERNGEQIAGSNWHAVKSILKTTGCVVLAETNDRVIQVIPKKAKILLNNLRDS